MVFFLIDILISPRLRLSHAFRHSFHGAGNHHLIQRLKPALWRHAGYQHPHQDRLLTALETRADTPLKRRARIKIMMPAKIMKNPIMNNISFLGDCGLL
jgi:hypothetical protein